MVETGVEIEKFKNESACGAREHLSVKIHDCILSRYTVGGPCGSSDESLNARFEKTSWNRNCTETVWSRDESFRVFFAKWLKQKLCCKCHTRVDLLLLLLFLQTVAKMASYFSDFWAYFRSEKMNFLLFRCIKDIKNCSKAIFGHTVIVLVQTNKKTKLIRVKKLPFNTFKPRFWYPKSCSRTIRCRVRVLRIGMWRVVFSVGCFGYETRLFLLWCLLITIFYSR